MRNESFYKIISFLLLVKMADKFYKEVQLEMLYET